MLPPELLKEPEERVPPDLLTELLGLLRELLFTLGRVERLCVFTLGRVDRGLVFTFRLASTRLLLLRLAFTLFLR